MIKDTLILVSSLIVAFDVIPYMLNTLNGKTKPKVVSWLVWSLLEAVAFLVALSEHQYPTAILIFFMLISTTSVAVFGWVMGGSNDVSRLDVFCFIGAVIGLIAWMLFDSPEVAMLLIIAIDFIGGVPTIIHSWIKPYEETVITYILSLVASVLTLIAIDEMNILSYAYPIFLVVIHLILTVVILSRRHYLGRAVL